MLRVKGELRGHLEPSCASRSVCAFRYIIFNIIFNKLQLNSDLFEIITKLSFLDQAFFFCNTKTLLLKKKISSHVFYVRSDINERKTRAEEGSSIPLRNAPHVVVL